MKDTAGESLIIDMRGVPTASGRPMSAGVRRAYGTAQMARLIAIKDHYDPENIFHLNHNIPPASPP